MRTCSLLLIVRTRRRCPGGMKSSTSTHKLAIQGLETFFRD